MKEPARVHTLFMQPAEYRICVAGRLDARWSERLGGLTITLREAPGFPTMTELTGVLPDQTALMGILQQLYLYLVPLLSVECLSVLRWTGPEERRSGDSEHE